MRLALVGSSGSGKTFSSLAIASGLGQRIAVLDTEHGSASKYADKFNFDVVELSSFHPMVPRKVGLAPIQRDGLEFEFDVVGNMNLENELIVSKSRCLALSGQIIAQPGLQLATSLKNWLLDGTPVSETKQVAIATNCNLHKERVKQICRRC